MEYYSDIFLCAGEKRQAVVIPQRSKTKGIVSTMFGWQFPCPKDISISFRQCAKDENSGAGWHRETQAPLVPIYWKLTIADITDHVETGIGILWFFRIVEGHWSKCSLFFCQKTQYWIPRHQWLTGGLASYLVSLRPPLVPASLVSTSYTTRAVCFHRVSPERATCTTRL